MQIGVGTLQRLLCRLAGSRTVHYMECDSLYNRLQYNLTLTSETNVRWHCIAKYNRYALWLTLRLKYVAKRDSEFPSNIFGQPPRLDAAFVNKLVRCMLNIKVEL